MRRIGSLVVMVLLAGCVDDATTTEEPAVETYTATLSPAAVVGSDVVSDGSGTATLVVEDDVLEYTIEVSAMQDITAAHIHGPASTDVNAPIRLTLFSPSEPTGPVSGVLVTGTAAAGSPALNTVSMDFVLDLIRNDSAFVMIHTSTYPDGEIRGHVIPQ